MNKAQRREAKRELNFRLGGEFKIPLAPFNKNLYHACKEIASMTDEEVAKFRKFNGDIKVRGIDCPNPVLNWFQCGLPDLVIDVIEKRNFDKPFPI